MKRKQLTNLIALAAVILMTALASCSKTDGVVMDYLANTDDAIIAADMQTIIENTGCTLTDNGIELSAALKKLNEENNEGNVKLLSIRGINLKNVIVKIASVDEIEDAMAIAEITDKAKLTDYLKDNGFEEGNGSDGMEIYSNKDLNAIIDGDALILSEIDIEDLVSVKKEASNNKLAAWKADKLISGKTLTAFVKGKAITALYSELGKGGLDLGSMMKNMGLEEYLNAVSFYEVQLDGAELKIASAAFDEDGKRIENPIEMSKANKDLLKYAIEEDRMVIAFGMPDSKFIGKMLESGEIPAAQQIMVKNVLESFTSVMIAGGPLNIKQYENPNGWHVVVAVEMKDGKASEYFTLLSTLAKQAGLSCTVNGDSMDIDFMIGKAFMKIEGNTLVASLTRPITTDGGCAIKASQLKGEYADVALNIPANSPNITSIDIPFGIEAFSGSMANNSEAYIKLTGTKGGFLENIINLAAEYK